MARFPQVGDSFSLVLNTCGDLGGCSGEAGSQSGPGTFLPPPCPAPPHPACPGSSHAGRLQACESHFALDAQVLASAPHSELMEDEPPHPTWLRRLPWLSAVGLAGSVSGARFRPLQVLPGADSGVLRFVLGLVQVGVEASEMSPSLCKQHPVASKCPAPRLPQETRLPWHEWRAGRGHALGKG